MVAFPYPRNEILSSLEETVFSPSRSISDTCVAIPWPVRKSLIFLANGAGLGRTYVLLQAFVDFATSRSFCFLMYAVVSAPLAGVRWLKLEMSFFFSCFLSVLAVAGTVP